MAGNVLTLQAHTEALKRMPEKLRAAFAATSQQAHVWAVDAHGEFVETHLHGNPVRRITGQLERSFQPVWSSSPTSFRAGVAFSPAMTGPEGAFPNYANILEEGGTISPKSGKLLAWPVSGGPATTAAGIARYAGPRAYPGKLFFHQGKGGKMYLAEAIPGKKNAVGPSLRYVYHLAPRVTIKARLGFRTWADAKKQAGREMVVNNFRSRLVA